MTLQTAGIVVTVASVVIIFGLVWLILHFIDPIYRFLGKTGSVVIARVMAMFIAAIATGYILERIGYFLNSERGKQKGKRGRGETASLSQAWLWDGISGKNEC